MVKETETEYMDIEEIIIHPRDYTIEIRKKLLNVLKKLGIRFKTKATRRMTKGMSKDDIERITKIETACCHMACNPCTYPHCMRYVREQLIVRGIIH